MDGEDDVEPVVLGVGVTVPVPPAVPDNVGAPDPVADATGDAVPEGVARALTLATGVPGAGDPVAEPLSLLDHVDAAVGVPLPLVGGVLVAPALGDGVPVCAAVVVGVTVVVSESAALLVPAAVAKARCLHRSQYRRLLAWRRRQAPVEG